VLTALVLTALLGWAAEVEDLSVAESGALDATLLVDMEAVEDLGAAKKRAKGKQHPWPTSAELSHDRYEPNEGGAKKGRKGKLKIPVVRGMTKVAIGGASVMAGYESFMVSATKSKAQAKKTKKLKVVAKPEVTEDVSLLQENESESFSSKNGTRARWMSFSSKNCATKKNKVSNATLAVPSTAMSGTFSLVANGDNKSKGKCHRRRRGVTSRKGIHCVHLFARTYKGQVQVALADYCDKACDKRTQVCHGLCKSSPDPSSFNFPKAGSRFVNTVDKCFTKCGDSGSLLNPGITTWNAAQRPLIESILKCKQNPIPKNRKQVASIGKMIETYTGHKENGAAATKGTKVKAKGPRWASVANKALSAATTAATKGKRRKPTKKSKVH